MSAKYVAVIPYAYQPYFDEFIARCTLPRENMLLIDNTVNNVGIMKAHNMGIDFMKQKEADWLIIMSAAIRFGPSGGQGFVDLLDQHPHHYIIHAATDNVVGGKQQEEGGGINGVFGWHLTAFHRRVFEAIGRWDENFTPYGFDDIDLSLRIQKHFKGEKTPDGAPGWDTFPCDVTDTTMGHSLQFGGVISPSGPLMEYFARKWGREAGDWQNDGYATPFNDPNNSLAFWPQAANGSRWDD